MGTSANSPAGRPASEMQARIEAERLGRPFLLYRDRDGRQRVFPLDPGREQVSVGRGHSADLVLDWHEEISRLHARLEMVGGDWTVEDDGLSRNGTFVNGERLGGRRRLSDGDDLRLGGVTLTFRAPRDRAGEQSDGAPPAAVDLSSSQHRVLVALCRLSRSGSALTGPEADQLLAEQLFLSPGAVRTHLGVLFAKLGVDRLPPDQRRIRVVEQAIGTGLVSDGDL